MVHKCRVAMSQKPAKKNSEKGRGLGHVTLIILAYPKNISKMRRARDLKFGTQTHRDNISKNRKEKFRKGAWRRSCDPYKFGNL